MIKKIIGIYSIKNLVNQKFYIGESVNVLKRLGRHKTNLKYNRHSNKHLQYAYNLYGRENFEFKIIEECSLEERFQREKYWVAYYDSFYNGYNMTPGGEDPRFFKDDDGNILEKSSWLRSFTEKEALDVVKRLKDGESVKHIADSYGVSTVPVTSIRNHQTWTKLTEGIDFSVYSLSREVDAYTNDGLFIKTFNSIVEASKELNISRNHITAVCKGQRNTVGDYIFRYHTHPFDEFQPKGQKTTAIDQFDMEWNYVRSFKSRKEAEEFIGVNIGGCLQQLTETAGGYRWLRSGEIISDEIKQQQIQDYREYKRMRDKVVPQIINLLLQGKTYKYISNTLNVKETLVDGIKKHRSWRNLTKDIVFPSQDKQKIAEVNKRAIDVYYLSGEFYKSFDSLASVKKELNINVDKIYKVCSGKQSQSHGFVFRYKGHPFDEFPLKYQKKAVMN